MACEDFINCDNNFLSKDDLLSLLLQTTADGCVALNTVRGSVVNNSFLLQEDEGMILQETGDKIII